MSGLIYKDLINLGQQWKSYLLILVLWGGLSVIQKNPYFFSGMFSVYAVIVLLTAFGYDEKSGWDKYALAMPMSRSRIVLSKYVLALLVDALGLVTSMAFFAAAKASVEETLTAQCIFQTLSLFLLAVQLPVIFKFGVEKARITVTMIILLPVFAAYIAVQAGFPMPDLEKLVSYIYLGPIAGLCLLAVSAWVSVRIYKGKEF